MFNSEENVSFLGVHARWLIIYSKVFSLILSGLRFLIFDASELISFPSSPSSERDASFFVYL